MAADTMKINAWLPLYVADYLGDTMHLTTLQHGAYLLLMMHHWRAGDLPDDDRQLAAIARLAPAEWCEIATVIRPFFDAADGHLTQKRLIAEMERARENKAVNSARGRTGAKARWGRKDAQSNAPSSAASIAQAMPEIGVSPPPSTLFEQIESKGAPSEGENASKDATSIAPSMLERCTSPSPNTSYSLLASHSAPPRKAGRSDQGSRLSEDWQPSSEDLEYARNLSLNVDRVAADFRCYWLAKAGKDGRMVRWDMVWQRWCRTAADKLSLRPPGPANSNGTLCAGPKRGDPPEKWLHLADKTEVDPLDGITKPVVGGIIST